MKTLPSVFRDPPKLSRDDHECLLEMGHEALTDLILNSRITSSAIAWTHHSTLPCRTRLYSAVDSITRDAIFCGITEIDTTLDDVISFFKVDHAHPERYFDHARLLARKAMDACTLAVLSPPSEADPLHYAGLHWMSMKTPGLFRNRDLCYLECHDEFELNGIRGWACVATSVRLPWIPSLEKSHQLPRAAIIRSGYVLREMPSQPGTIQVAHIAHMDYFGHMPGIVARKSLEKEAGSVSLLANLLRIRDTMFIPTTPNVKQPQRGYCASCDSKLHYLKPGIVCKTCGDIVCKKCLLLNDRCKNCCYGHPERHQLRSTLPPNFLRNSSNSDSSYRFTQGTMVNTPPRVTATMTLDKNLASDSATNTYESDVLVEGEFIEEVGLNCIYSLRVGSDANASSRSLNAYDSTRFAVR